MHIYYCLLILWQRAMHSPASWMECLWFDIAIISSTSIFICLHAYVCMHLLNSKFLYLQSNVCSTLYYIRRLMYNRTCMMGNYINGENRDASAA